ncbi:MAG: hypothetical protein AAF215_22145 [Cyanobacteria bacterium P01_A01_bin.123]
MNLKQDIQLTALKSELLTNMHEYMLEVSAQYKSADIEHCKQILDEHLRIISVANNEAQALNCVRSTVMQLNTLNKKCGGELIETGERELICEFIIRASVLCGFNDKGADITEVWREW